MPTQDLPQRDLVFREKFGEKADGFSLTLKRNCSISPSGLLRVFAALSAGVMAIGAGFAIVGAWLILPFAGLEVALLGAAFVLYARRAADYERIELAGGRLTIDVVEAQRSERYDLDAGRARVFLEQGEGYGARVWLQGGREKELEVGRHLDAQARAEFAAELSRRLRVRGKLSGECRT